MILFLSGGSTLGIVRTQLYIQNFLDAGCEVCVLSYYPEEFSNCLSLKYREKPNRENILSQIPRHVKNKLVFVTTVFDVYIDLVGKINSELGLRGIKFDDAVKLRSKKKVIEWVCSEISDFELLPFYDTIPKDTPAILKPDSGTGAIRYNEWCYTTVVNQEKVDDVHQTFGALVAQKKWQGDQTILAMSYYYDGSKIHNLFVSNVVNDKDYHLISYKKVDLPCVDIRNWSFLKNDPFGLFFNIQCFFDSTTGRYLPFDFNSRFSGTTHECISKIDPTFMSKAVHNILTGEEITPELKLRSFDARRSSLVLNDPRYTLNTNKIPKETDLDFRHQLSCYVGEDYDKTPIESIR